jgi:hypothetical protein
VENHFDTITTKINEILKMPSYDTNNEEIKLTIDRDWEAWEQHLQRLAVGGDIWNLIDPNSTDRPMTKPVSPVLDDYVTPLNIPTPSVNTSTSNRQLRSRPTAPQNQPGSEERSATPNTSDQTAEQRARYNVAYQQWAQLMKAYNEENHRVQEVRKWIMKTVVSHLQQIACKPTESLRQWYTNLRDAVGVENFDMAQEVRSKYRAATAPVHTMPKDFTAWINRWEIAVGNMEDKSMPEASDAKLWFNDLQTALRGHYEVQNFLSNFRIMKEAELKSNTLSFRKVAFELRKLADNLKPHTRRVQKGAFAAGPTFDGKDDTSEPAIETREVEELQEHPKNKQKKKQTTRTKRPRTDTTDSASADPRPASRPRYDRPSCKLCSKRHSLEDCWFVFPEKMPSYSNQSRSQQAMADKILSSNPELAAEVARIRERAQEKKD